MRRLTRPRLAESVDKTGGAAAINFDPGRYQIPQDHLFNDSALLFHHLYHQALYLAPPYRIFAVSKPFRLQIYIAAAAVVAFWIGSTVADLFNCIPLDWTWKNGAADSRYCVNYNTFWFVTGIFETLVDSAILALPLSMVSKLHLDRSKK